VGEVVEKCEAVLSKEWQDTQAAFLKSAMWVQRIEQDALVPFQNARPEIFGLGSLPSEFRELVQHFTFGRLQHAQ